MRKIMAVMTILVSSFLLFGCQQKNDFKSQFSEITKIYYNGISTDGNMSASISVGEREDPYIIDGKHGQMVEFSLLVVKFHYIISENDITIDFYCGERGESIVLEFNPINSTYMTDLGYAIDEEKEYSIKYDNNTLIFSKASDNFKLDYNSAMEKSLEVLGDEVKQYYNGNNFQGECYLKILSKPDGNFQDLYWYFTIVGQNDNSSIVVIDIKDGSIILSN